MTGQGPGTQLDEAMVSLANALSTALASRRPPADPADPALGQVAETIGAAGIELWMRIDDSAQFVRTAMWVQDLATISDASLWTVDANHPFWPAVDRGEPVMYVPVPESPHLDRACAAPILSTTGTIGFLMAWPQTDAAYSDADCATFLELAQAMAEQVSARDGAGAVSPQHLPIDPAMDAALDAAAGTVTRTLLDRHSGDPDDRLIGALTTVGNDLDANFLVLYSFDEDGAVRSGAGWSRGGYILHRTRRRAFVDPFLTSLGDVLVGTEVTTTEWNAVPGEARETMAPLGYDQGPIISFPIVVDGYQAGGLALCVPESGRWLADRASTLQPLAVAMHFYLESRAHDQALTRSVALEAGLAALVGSTWELESVDDAESLVDALSAVAAALEVDGIVLHHRVGSGFRNFAGWAKDGFELPVQKQTDRLWERREELRSFGQIDWYPSDEPPAHPNQPRTSFGRVIAVGGAENLTGAVTVFRDQRPFGSWEQPYLERLETILRASLRRLELQRADERRRELEALRLRVAARLLPRVDGEEESAAAFADVFRELAQVFEVDEVFWGNMLRERYNHRGYRYVRSMDVLSAMPEAAMVIDETIELRDLVAIVRLDFPSMRLLGADPVTNAGARVTIARTTLDDEDVWGVALFDHSGEVDFDEAELETLSAVDMLVHQFEMRRQETRAAERHHRYDSLRIEIGTLLLDAADADLNDVLDGALASIGAAFGADVVIYDDRDTGGQRSWRRWQSARGERLADTMHRVGARDPLFEEYLAHTASGRTRPMRMDDVSPDLQSKLDACGIESAEMVGAVVEAGARQTTLGIGRWVGTGWDQIEQTALHSIGSQLQQAGDAVVGRHRSNQRRSLDALVRRTASALIEEGVTEGAFESVLLDLVQSLDAAGGAWVEYDPDAQLLTVPHTVTARGRARRGPSFDLDPATWDRMWAGGATTKWCGPDDDPLRTLASLDSTVEWTSRVVSPVIDESGPIGILDIQLREDPQSEALLSTISTVGHLIFEAVRRIRSTELFTTMFESAPTGQLLLDDQLRVRACNASFRERFGDLTGTLWPEFDETFAIGEEEREVRLSAGRHARWTRIRTSQVETPHASGSIVVHVEDVTAHRAAKAMLEFDATHDQLTGLGNRRRLDQLLQERLQSDAVAVMMLDIDRFKIVNDSLGHSAGDEMLITIADRLRLAVRGGDVVCRFGGDEFAILLRDSGEPDELSAVARRLLDLVRAPILIRNVRTVPTCSIGIATVEQGSEPDLVLRHADWALATAKRAGPDRYEFFNPSDADVLRNRLQLEADLRGAVDNDEFLPFFQPEYDMATGEIIGLEALVRWEKPEEGIVPAYQFIDAAEELGLAPRMSQLVLERSCAEGRRWADLGFRPQLRVNITAAQLQSEGLEFEVISTLSRYDLPPEQLCLEVTERSIMLDLDTAIDTLARIRAVGVEVAIDDFGTGFSSLAWLKRLPVDTLKIDRSFIQNVTTDAADREIVRTIIGLADGLGLDVVAEGVEEAEHVGVLLELGCRRAQGWLWSPAVPADEMTVLLAAEPWQAPVAD